LRPHGDATGLRLGEPVYGQETAASVSDRIADEPS
jgi:hypothetical protein